MNNYLQMTQKELDINTVIDQLIKKQMWIKEASKRINKCIKQTRRIRDKYRKEGSKWLIHKARWKPSNNKWNNSKYFDAVQIVKEKYHDYWPTLSAEKLFEKHSIKIPVSTLRLQMIKNWIWKWKTRKKQSKQFTARPRKESYWEMIQYDWSYHLWFEGRDWTRYQCLLVAVDDATWEVTAKFALNEGLVETMKFWKEYMLEKWKPKTIYLDKFATYKVNYPNATDDKELPTQFRRACNNLNIELIFANTPQAKWRVERMNWTFQDRLVKALREENISNIIDANKFLKEIFLPDFNKKFMVEAKSDSNLHLNLRDDEILKLDQIFSKHISRKIANDFTIKIDNKFYQLYRKKEWKYTIRPKETITVEKHLNWDIKISKNWIYIEHRISHDRPERAFKLLTAPISESNLDLMKKNITKLEKINKTKKEKENNKTDTYYEKHWKCSPYIANCFN
jgi:transposase